MKFTEKNLKKIDRPYICRDCGEKSLFVDASNNYSSSSSYYRCRFCESVALTKLKKTYDQIDALNAEKKRFDGSIFDIRKQIKQLEEDITGIEKQKKDIDVCLNEIDGEPLHDVPQQSNASKM